MYLNEKLKEIVGEPGLRPLVVKADPFSLDSLIARLEKQRGEVEYCYTSAHGDCLWARFTVAMGGTIDIENGDYYIGPARLTTSCFQWQSNGEPWRSDVAGYQPHTMGAALSRARALRDTNG